MRLAATIPAVFAPQLLFLAATAVSEDLFLVHEVTGSSGRFAIVVVVAFVVGVVMASSIFAWLERDDPATARFLLAVAAASTMLSAMGMAAGIFVIGLLSACGVFFLMSLPVLALAAWNARTV